MLFRSTEKVSLVEFFKNAHKYRALAGEMVTQDFAVDRRFMRRRCENEVEIVRKAVGEAQDRFEAIFKNIGFIEFGDLISDHVPGLGVAVDNPDRQAGGFMRQLPVFQVQQDPDIGERKAHPAEILKKAVDRFFGTRLIAGDEGIRSWKN